MFLIRFNIDYYQDCLISILSFVRRLLKTGFPEQVAFQKALYEYVGSLNSKYTSEHDEFFISFEGSFGSRHVTPRTLTSRFLGNMVCLEGIVTKGRCTLMFVSTSY